MTYQVSSDVGIKPRHCASELFLITPLGVLISEMIT